MKKVIASAILLATTGFARTPIMPPAGPHMNVKVSEVKNGKFSINFTTKRTHSSMCFLSVNDLRMKTVKNGLPGNSVQKGEISFRTYRDPMGRCLMAFGPHRGSLQLEIGRALPKVQNGIYSLKIDGASHGELLVAKDKVSLKDSKPALKSFQGTLMTGIMAIGGETTGTILITKKGTYELAMSSAEARRFHGQKVYVTGTLTYQRGVEIPLRKIIKVKSVKNLFTAL